MKFTPENKGMKLIMFTGVPGTGKSTLSEAVGRALNIPVFALDWVLGTLVQHRVPHQDNVIRTTGALLITLTKRQLMLGQSVILDIAPSKNAARRYWRGLAHSYGAAFYQIETICSDISLHHQRVEARCRGIPGLPETVSWDFVEQERAAFEPWEPWESDRLTLDAVNPLDNNIQAIMKYVVGTKQSERIESLT